MYSGDLCRSDFVLREVTAMADGPEAVQPDQRQGCMRSSGRNSVYSAFGMSYRGDTEIQPNIIACNAAISACVSCWHRDVA